MWFWAKNSLSTSKINIQQANKAVLLLCKIFYKSILGFINTDKRLIYHVGIQPFGQAGTETSTYTFVAFPENSISQRFNAACKLFPIVSYTKSIYLWSRHENCEKLVSYKKISTHSTLDSKNLLIRTYKLKFCILITIYIRTHSAWQRKIGSSI